LPPPYRCPACDSKDIIEYDEIIECPKCNLEFFKDHLGEIDPENQLSIKELNGIVGAFTDEGSVSSRKRLSKALEEDD